MTTNTPSFFSGIDVICDDEASIRELINSKREQKPPNPSKKEDSIYILKLKMDDIEIAVKQLQKEFPNSSEKIKIFINKLKEKYGSNDIIESKAAEDNDEPNE